MIFVRELGLFVEFEMQINLLIPKLNKRLVFISAIGTLTRIRESSHANVNNTLKVHMNRSTIIWKVNTWAPDRVNLVMTTTTSRGLFLWMSHIIYVWRCMRSIAVNAVWLKKGNSAAKLWPSAQSPLKVFPTIHVCRKRGAQYLWLLIWMVRRATTVG